MRKKIGIITGFGPEAGINLWQKVLSENRQFLKEKYQGDIDAPDMTILSCPKLGHTMELEKNYEMIWQTLKEAVEEISQKVDFFVIAGNALNVYEKRIEELGYKDKFLSTLDVVTEYLHENNLEKAAIIGALPVIQMKEFSAFQSLNNHFKIEVPKHFSKVHELIESVKKEGGENHRVIHELRQIVDELKCKDIFLASAQLPLIKLKYANKNLIDVSALLAKKLVLKSF